MKTRREILAAIADMIHAREAAIQAADWPCATACNLCVDALLWTMGIDSQFGAMLQEMGELDEAARRFAQASIN